jgi:hypothetical protein
MNTHTTVVKRGVGCKVRVKSKVPGMVSVRKGNVAHFSYGIAPIKAA